MWWQDLLWGVWNGLTAWIVLIAPLWGVALTFPIRRLVQLVMGSGR